MTHKDDSFWTLIIGMLLLAFALTFIPHAKAMSFADDPPVCDQCHKTYAKCIFNVLMETDHPDNTQLAHIETCKKIRNKCTGENKCSNHEVDQ